MKILSIEKSVMIEHLNETYRLTIRNANEIFLYHYTQGYYYLLDSMIIKDNDIPVEYLFYMLVPSNYKIEKNKLK